MMVTAAHISRLERALTIAARVVARDTAALPIFARLDRELTSAQMVATAARTGDPVAHARALLKAHQASGATA